MPDVFLVARSHTLAKVLAFNSVAAFFEPTQKPRTTRPGTLPDVDAVQGAPEASVLPGGETIGMIATASIFLQPYCEGPPGTSFYLNVWGFSDAGSGNAKVWIPFFIVQLYCSSGLIPGPSETGYLAAKEYLCDTMAVTAGTLGMGYLQSPGGDSAGYAKIDLLGSRYFEIEFAADPTSQNIPSAGVPGMNALWRPL